MEGYFTVMVMIFADPLAQRVGCGLLTTSFKQANKLVGFCFIYTHFGKGQIKAKIK